MSLPPSFFSLFSSKNEPIYFNLIQKKKDEEKRMTMKEEDPSRPSLPSPPPFRLLYLLLDWGESRGGGAVRRVRLNDPDLFFLLCS